MEVASLLCNWLADIVDRIEYRHLLLRPIFQCDAETLAEEHVPVTSKGAARIDAHRQGHQRRILIQIATEKSPNGALHSGRFLAIPVDAQDLTTPYPGGRQPNLANLALVLNIRQRQYFACRDEHTRIHLPTRVQVTNRFIGISLFHAQRRPCSFRPTDSRGRAKSFGTCAADSNHSSLLSVYHKQLVKESCRLCARVSQLRYRNDI